MPEFSVSGMQCCGVKEFYGVNSVNLRDSHADILAAIKRALLPTFRNGDARIFAHYIFTSNGADSADRMRHIRDAIKSAKLGICRTTLKSATNPNTNNQIMVMVWTPEVKPLIAFVGK